MKSELLPFQGSTGIAGLKGYRGDSGGEVMFILYNFTTDYRVDKRHCLFIPLLSYTGWIWSTRLDGNLRTSWTIGTKELWVIEWWWLNLGIHLKRIWTKYLQFHEPLGAGNHFNLDRTQVKFFLNFTGILLITFESVTNYTNNMFILSRNFAPNVLMVIL